MKPPGMRAWLVLLGILPLLAGCTGPTELEPHGSDPLTVAVTVLPGDLKLGETVAIHVKARNLTDTTVRFRTNGCPLVLEIRDSDGRRVFPRNLVCTSIGMHHEIAPGEVLERQFAFTGYVFHADTGEFQPLAEGHYWVRGGVTAEFRNLSPAASLRVVR